MAKRNRRRKRRTAEQEPVLFPHGKFAGQAMSCIPSVYLSQILKEDREPYTTELAREEMLRRSYLSQHVRNGVFGSTTCG